MAAAAFMAVIPMLMQMMEKRNGGMGGSNEKFGSSYGQGAQNALTRAQGEVANMSQGGAADITRNQNYQGGSEWLNRLFSDPQFFKQFEAPLMRQYEEETLPNLANRFGGMGTHGSFGTGFRNATQREATNLYEKIAALRGNLQQQGTNQALQYAQQPASNYMQLLQQATTPTQNTYQPASTGLLGAIPGLISGYAQGAGQKWGESQAQPSYAGGSPSASLPTNVSLPSAANSATNPYLYGGY
jgi:hypothetical protein